MAIITRRGIGTHLPITQCIFHLNAVPKSPLYYSAQPYLCGSSPCCRLLDVSINSKCLQGGTLPNFYKTQNF